MAQPTKRREKAARTLTPDSSGNTAPLSNARHCLLVYRPRATSRPHGPNTPTSSTGNQVMSFSDAPSPCHWTRPYTYPVFKSRKPPTVVLIKRCLSLCHGGTEVPGVVLRPSLGAIQYSSFGPEVSHSHSTPDSHAAASFPARVIQHCTAAARTSSTLPHSIERRRDYRAPLPTLSPVFFSIWVRFYHGEEYPNTNF